LLDNEAPADLPVENPADGFRGKEEELAEITGEENRICPT
jgi:hypothetical protein